MPVEVVEQEPMRDFGSKLADYEASDEPVMDLNSLESERTQFLRQNDETVDNEAEADDDAVRCIPKVMQVSFKLQKLSSISKYFSGILIEIESRLLPIDFLKGEIIRGSCHTCANIQRSS